MRHNFNVSRISFQIDYSTFRIKLFLFNFNLSSSTSTKKFRISFTETVNLRSIFEARIRDFKFYFCHFYFNASQLGNFFKVDAISCTTVIKVNVPAFDQWSRMNNRISLPKTIVRMFVKPVSEKYRCKFNLGFYYLCLIKPWLLERWSGNFHSRQCNY